jgi:SAM-dependent methyltransferase
MEFVDPADKSPLALVGDELVNSSGRRYPIVRGIPHLFLPDSLQVDPPRDEMTMYEGALKERAFYDGEADLGLRDLENSLHWRRIRQIVEDHGGGPYPEFSDPVWLDAVFDCVAQSHCHQFIGSVVGQSAVQVGGYGTYAVKMALAGANEVILVTPMEGEAEYFLGLAELAGVSDRARAVVASAEELPFASDSIDVVLSGGCFHHTVIPVALEEASRVLARGGRFAAWDPWRAPLYRIGTGLVGKRVADVNCRPIDLQRLAGAPGDVDVMLFGPVTRYALLALWKAGVEWKLPTALTIMSGEDRVLKKWPTLRRWGSSVAMTIGRT